MITFDSHYIWFRRYERQIESDQKTFEEQKARLSAGVEAEKQRWKMMMHEKELDYERRKIELLEERKDEIFHLRNEHAERLSMLETKTQVMFVDIMIWFVLTNTNFVVISDKSIINFAI